MHNDKPYFDHMLKLARWPAPSDDLFMRIMAGSYPVSRYLHLKVSAMLMGVVMIAFAAGFMQFLPAVEQVTAKTPYYAGSGLYIVKSLG